MVLPKSSVLYAIYPAISIYKGSLCDSPVDPAITWLSHLCSSHPVTLGSTQLSEQSIVHLLSKGNNQIFIICNSLNNHLLGLLVVQFLLLFLYLYNKIFVLSTLSVFVSLSITLLSCRCPLGLGYHELLNY